MHCIQHFLLFVIIILLLFLLIVILNGLVDDDAGFMVSFSTIYIAIYVYMYNTIIINNTVFVKMFIVTILLLLFCLLSFTNYLIPSRAQKSLQSAMFLCLFTADVYAYNRGFTFSTCILINSKHLKCFCSISF